MGRRAVAIKKTTNKGTKKKVTYSKRINGSGKEVNNVGRNSVFSDEIMVETLCQSIQLGNTLRGACEEVGIAYQTLQNMRSTARKIEAEGLESDSDAYKGTVIWKAYDRFQKAQGAFRKTALLGIQKAGMRHDKWQALAWMLERRFPDEFALTTRAELSGRDGKALEIKSTLNAAEGSNVISDSALCAVIGKAVKVDAKKSKKTKKTKKKKKANNKG